MGLKAKLKPTMVKRFLVEKNRPHKWLAAQLKTSTGYLCQLMNGTRNPSPAMRQKFMDVMKVKDFEDLFIVIK